jgi:hypothetical protein
MLHVARRSHPSSRRPMSLDHQAPPAAQPNPARGGKRGNGCGGHGESGKDWGGRRRRR